MAELFENKEIQEQVILIGISTGDEREADAKRNEIKLKECSIISNSYILSCIKES